MTEPMPAPPGSAGNRRALGILVAVLGVIIVGFLAFTLLGSDSSNDTTTPTTLSGTPTTVRSPTATTAPVAAAETFEVFNTKNPFVPLRGATGSSTSGSTGSTGTGTTGTGSTGTGTGTGVTTSRTGTGTTGTGSTGTGSTGTGSTGSTGTGSTGTGSGGSSEPSRGQRVSLLDVFSEGGKVVANVKVNDTVYKVAAGQVFATSFKAVSLSQADGCGRFLFGDDQFRLCKGEQVVK
ncbi:MAG: hypothetical protein QOI20_2059 [Acidimicrobiaceae bacterium]|nr:hypothetical protein [Acidimicrobiaceae bacterium]